MTKIVPCRNHVVETKLISWDGEGVAGVSGAGLGRGGRWMAGTRRRYTVYIAKVHRYHDYTESARNISHDDRGAEASYQPPRVAHKTPSDGVRHVSSVSVIMAAVRRYVVCQNVNYGVTGTEQPIALIYSLPCRPPGGWEF
ncbi:hypothetical protein Bbelb_175150 [Branchiostoma belcheri]|nr:hypothetical protein Bbelb_175150 [Branchiostoma belcheri]